MKLSRIPILRETIDVRDEVDFQVRGINLSDLMSLMQSHAPVAMILWRKLQEDDKELRSQDVKDVFGEVAVQFPDLVAAIISMAADDNTVEGRAVARTLPADVQSVALEAIFRLSFQSESTLEKLASLAAKVIQGTTRVMEIAQLPSQDGSGASVAA